MLERLGPDGYTTEITDQVYATLAERAALAMRGGYIAIVDAVFIKPTHRQMLERVATVSGVPFVGLWLDTPEKVLVERLQHRQSDASDADVSVLRRQQKQNVGAMAWHTLDASASVDVVLQQAEARVRR